MDKSKNRTLIVKIVCLLLSFGLWLYVSNVENPSRTRDLNNIPVELINENSLADSKFAIENKEQFTVDLKLEGPSNEVLKAKKEDFRIVADMSAYALKIGENTIPVQIINAPQNITIKNNGFLGIKINLEELVKKEFTIKSKVKVTYKDNIYEKQQVIAPKTVTVTGGKSSIEKINDAVLVGEEKNVDKNLQNDYDVKFVDVYGSEVGNIEPDNKTAKLSITVTNGKSVPINLKTSGSVPNGFVLDGYELNKNSVNILGDSSNINKVQVIDTEPVNISSMQEDSEINTKLSLPEGVNVEDGDNVVKVKFKVRKEENATKNVTCNVQVKNLDESFSLGTQNLAVNVTLTGTQAVLDKINAESINVILDLSTLKEEGTFNYTPQATLVSGNGVTISDVGSVKIVVKKKE